jgi:hypothetical protein
MCDYRNDGRRSGNHMTMFIADEIAHLAAQQRI